MGQAQLSLEAHGAVRAGRGGGWALLALARNWASHGPAGPRAEANGAGGRRPPLLDAEAEPGAAAPAGDVERWRGREELRRGRGWMDPALGHRIRRQGRSGGRAAKVVDSSEGQRGEGEWNFICDGALRGRERERREGEGGQRKGERRIWPGVTGGGSGSPEFIPARCEAIPATGTSGREHRALSTLVRDGGMVRAPRPRTARGGPRMGLAGTEAMWGAGRRRGGFPLAAGVLRGGGWPPGWRQVAGTRWPAVEIEERRWEAAG